MLVVIEKNSIIYYQYGSNEASWFAEYKYAFASQFFMLTMQCVDLHLN